MNKGKKFIAPGAWFSMTYPADWNEFEGGEDSFLFYNADDWDGNFRISAFRGEQADYGQATVREELKKSRRAQAVMVGDFPCAYSCEIFTEEGETYENHQDLVVCSFFLLLCRTSLCPTQHTLSLPIEEQLVSYPLISLLFLHGLINQIFLGFLLLPITFIFP